MSLLIVVAFVRFYSYQADFSCAERLDINLKKILMTIFGSMHVKAAKCRQKAVAICGEPCIPKRHRTKKIFGFGCTLAHSLIVGEYLEKKIQLMNHDLTNFYSVGSVFFLGAKKGKIRNLL